MNVSITPELGQLVQALVASGRYHSASEVVREGLRLLEQAERRRLLEKLLLKGLAPDEQAAISSADRNTARRFMEEKIEEGLAALDRGQVVDAESFFARRSESSATPNAVHKPKKRLKRQA
jgi:antitoxin ParD1/3/4